MARSKSYTNYEGRALVEDWVDVETKELIAVTRNITGHGLVIEVEVSAEKWEETEFLWNEAGRLRSRKDLEAMGTVIPLTPFKLNAKAEDLRQLATRCQEGREGKIAEKLFQKAMELRMQSIELAQKNNVM